MITSVASEGVVACREDDVELAWPLTRPLHVANAERIRAVRIGFHEQGRAGTPSEMFNTVQQSIFDEHFPGLQATMALTTSARLGAPVVRIENCAATGVVYAYGNPVRLVVYGMAPATTQVAVVNTSSSGVNLEQVPAMDGPRCLTRIELTNTPVDALALDDRAWDWWTDAVAWGRLALAWELIGGATAALEAATAYAQMWTGPLGTSHAVQRRLAGTTQAIEAARAVAALPKENLNPRVAAMGKALAGQAYAVTAASCTQVFGGAGFPPDHPIDRHLRRGRCLDSLLGSSTALANELEHSVLQ
jgi:alkylation response protein AidB-like acyl-CoA dehydrogenase